MSTRKPLNQIGLNRPTKASLLRQKSTTTASSTPSEQLLARKRKREQATASRQEAMGITKRRAVSTTSTTRRTATTATTSRVASKKNTTTARSGTTTARSGTTTKRSTSKGRTTSKRPQWDVKGRLEDLEQIQNKLKQEVLISKKKAIQLESKLAEKENVVGQLAESKTILQKDVSHYEQRIQDIETEKIQLMTMIESIKAQHKSQMDMEAMKYKMLNSDHTTLKAQHNVLQSESATQKMEIATKTAEIESLNAKMEALTKQLNDTTSTLKQREDTIDDLENTIANQKDKIIELEEQAREDEMVRRKLHNSIQELKGNIRVFCRVRPLLGDELSQANQQLYSFPKTNGCRTIDVKGPNTTSTTGAEKNGKMYSFTFDKVFNPDATQSKVFEELSGFVQSSLDGYNACVFTYGQTGSGKTFTMEGPEKPNEETRGMIPRTVSQIFASANHLEKKGWKYTFEAFYLEIYNEKIRDLLTTNSNAKPQKHVIKHKPDGTTYVTGITVVPVTSPNEIHRLLQRASKNRAVASTNCNERSSRSHSVFQLKIVGNNDITGESGCGLLNLIDLAGSERLSSSGSTGQRLKETQNINKSLTCLGDVICALANKDSHIPYRNSKLTYLLQNCLGGNSKTLMFVNISPASPDLNETLSSLRFAKKVNACEIGIARKGGRVSLSS